jgi:hypothetical protein
MLCEKYCKILVCGALNRTKNKAMKLSIDPYQVFESSKTPAALYARQKWLGESDNRQWKKDFHETVEKLTADQASDGSWHQSEVETITRLFGLHLTVRETSDQINAALEWLKNRIKLPYSGHQFELEVDGIKDPLEKLPFMCCHPDMFLIGATLFLSSIFGRPNDPSILSIYRWLSLVGVRNKGLWFDRACSHNILRAMVVHPVYCEDPATVMAVESLADQQAVSGEWRNGSPFFQTLNALAHLNILSANQQLQRAFPRLFETQNGDGTWGEVDREWNSFLVVHAMRNKDLI